MAKWYFCWRCKLFNLSDPKDWVCDRCKKEMEREVRRVE